MGDASLEQKRAGVLGRMVLCICVFLLARGGIANHPKSRLYQLQCVVEELQQSWVCLGAIQNAHCAATPTRRCGFYGTDTNIYHVGLVTTIDPLQGIMTTIEGNDDNAVREEKHPLTHRGIFGFARIG
jgi:hypothetical protein